MIKAVIFDMDGLLIDSEPIWREIEVELLNSLGVPLTEDRTVDTMGLRADEVVRHWHHRYPWKTPSQEHVAEQLVDRMVREISRRDIALPGVRESIDVVEAAGLPIAIASSSPLRLIKSAIRSLDLESRLQTIVSAEHEKYGKPHPAVYIKTAEKLGVAPEHCLAFEDSPNGVLAAKAAKMKCVAVPDATMKSNPVYGIADVVLDSLLDFDQKLLDKLCS